MSGYVAIFSPADNVVESYNQVYVIVKELIAVLYQVHCFCWQHKGFCYAYIQALLSLSYLCDEK